MRADGASAAAATRSTADPGEHERVRDQRGDRTIGRRLAHRPATSVSTVDRSPPAPAPLARRRPTVIGRAASDVPAGERVAGGDEAWSPPPATWAPIGSEQPVPGGERHSTSTAGGQHDRRRRTTASTSSSPAALGDDAALTDGRMNVDGSRRSAISSVMARIPAPRRHHQRRHRAPARGDGRCCRATRRSAGRDARGELGADARCRRRPSPSDSSARPPEHVGRIAAERTDRQAVDRCGGRSLAECVAMSARPSSTAACTSS